MSKFYLRNSNICSNILKVTTLSLLVFGFSFFPIFQIHGKQISFKLIEFFYPMAGAISGSILGSLSVILGKVSYLIFAGKNISMLQFITTAFVHCTAVFVFSKKRLLNLIVPIFAIVVFLTNDIGLKAWPYAMYWFIPIVGHFFREKSIVIRSLVTTFSSHAAGGLMWILTYDNTAEFWRTLIPIVAVERFVFTMGMSVIFVLAKNISKTSIKEHIMTIFSLLNKRFNLHQTKKS